MSSICQLHLALGFFLVPFVILSNNENLGKIHICDKGVTNLYKFVRDKRHEQKNGQRIQIGNSKKSNCVYIYMCVHIIYIYILCVFWLHWLWEQNTVKNVLSSQLKKRGVNNASSSLYWQRFLKYLILLLIWQVWGQPRSHMNFQGASNFIEECLGKAAEQYVKSKPLRAHQF